MKKNNEFDSELLLILCSPDDISKYRNEIPPNFQVLKEISTLYLKPELILKSFSDGKNGVLIIQFQDREKIDESENQFFENKIKVIKRLLNYFGLNPKRLSSVSIVSSEEERIVEITHQFLKTIEELGENPYCKQSGGPKILPVIKKVELDDSDEEARYEGILAVAVDIARTLLENNKITAVLGKKWESGQVVPCLFKSEVELNELILSPDYNLAKILVEHQNRNPDEKIGVVVYPCEERAINELNRRSMLDDSKIELIKATCTEAQGSACTCELSYPGSVEINERIDNIMNMNLLDRSKFWNYQFSKCIKCYGCRDNCPTGSSGLSILEDNEWVKRGRIPPELSFHLIRLYHMSDKCIGCGECEAACPVEIPLSILQHQIIRDMRRLFSYEAGFKQILTSPLNIAFEPDTTFGGGE